MTLLVNLTVDMMNEGLSYTELKNESRKQADSSEACRKAKVCLLN